jgi:GDP-L-fucose synthase
MEINSKIYIAGHNGLVGSAIIRYLQQQNYTNLVYKSSKELNLMNEDEVFAFFEKKSQSMFF